MYGSMYWCGEILVCVAVRTGVGKYKYLYVWHYLQVWGNINTCMCGSMYRCGETLACVVACTGVGKHLHMLPSHPTLGGLLGLQTFLLSKAI